MSEQKIKVEEVIQGWCGNGRGKDFSLLATVVFFVPGDQQKYAGLVLMCRRTGELRLPTYFRHSANTKEGSGENCQMPSWVTGQVETAARKFAGNKVPSLRHAS
jgi:hypothetical protein